VKNHVFLEVFINLVLTAVNENVARSFDVRVVSHFPSFDITKIYKTSNIPLCKSDYMRFDVPTEVVMKSYIFWVITSCSLLKVNRRFWGTCHLHLRSLRISQARNRALLTTCFHAGFLLGLYFEPQTEAKYSSETSTDFQRATQRYISENRPLQII
jgi:hypothetical protein